MSKRKPKPGDVVRVEFRDHAQEMDGTIECVAWGRMVEPVNAGDVRVRVWESRCNPPKHDDANHTHFDLASGAIKSITAIEQEGGR